MTDTPQHYVDGTPFFGRAEQQKRFRTLLRELREPPQPHDASEHLPTIMLIYGDGGIGKTTLLARFMQIIREDEFADQCQLFRLDWDDHRDQIISPDAEAVFEAFYKAATAHRPWGREPFAAYQDLKQRHDEVEQKVARQLLSMEQSSNDLKALRHLTPRDLALFLRKQADMSHVCNLLNVAIDNRKEQERLRSSAETHLMAHLSSSEFDLFKDPQRELARALGESLRDLSDTQPLVILLDTYEVVDRADQAFRVVLKESGPRVVWVIAGRNNLRSSGQDDTGYVRGYAEDFSSSRLISYDVEQLALDDVRRYFAVQVPDAPLDDEHLEAIAQATRGIPLAVRQAAQIYQHARSVEAVVADLPRGIPHYEIIKDMTERYARYCLQNQTDKQALYMLALADGNEQVLRALRLEEGTGQDFNTFMLRLERVYASVYRHIGQGIQQSYQLHEAPALFFREHLRAQRSEAWVQTCLERAVNALRDELARQEQQMPLIEERCEDDEEGGWVANAIELARYLLWKDEEEALQWIIPRFVEGLAYSTKLCSGLQQMLRNEEKLLSKRGKTWLKAFESAGYVSSFLVFVYEAQLHEELRRPRHQRYLAGADETERWAIIAMRQGALCVDRKPYQQAQQLYAEAERGLPAEGEKLREQLAMQWRNLANILNNQRRWAEALDAGNHSLRLNPDDKVALNNRGWTHIEIGEYEQALDDLNRSLELAPDDPVTLKNRGGAYLVIGEYEQALDDLNRSLKLAPYDPVTLHNRGNVYRALGMYEQALQEYNQSLESESDPRTYTVRGICYAYMGQYAQAQDDFDQAQQIGTYPDWPLFGLAVSSALQDDTAATLDYLRQGLEADSYWVWQRSLRGYHHDHAFAPLCRRDPQFAAAFEALLQEFTPPWANPQKGDTA